ncbi:hypothetical protein [Candidatus Aquicultor secundus]|uniref:hypothetical protein n=1 Tax=Candidatus Aquicultor secundus TaxID=1973895 RepID=UPI000CC1E262|nr:hypothetical protein [Candidatus Aquicultor secundus]PIY40279.1 MAG: hypothetical protein COZ03_04455 [Candidatus Aquicultor secundus]
MVRGFTKQKAKFSLLVVIMILIVGSVLPATANASTGYFFDGGKRSVSNNGAYLACETQNPAVAANSSVSVWPMVTDGVGNYAQVGWLKYASWDRITFTNIIISLQIFGSKYHIPRWVPRPSEVLTVLKSGMTLPICTS